MVSGQRRCLDRTGPAELACNCAAVDGAGASIRPQHDTPSAVLGSVSGRGVLGLGHRRTRETRRAPGPGAPDSRGVRGQARPTPGRGRGGLLRSSARSISNSIGRDMTDAGTCRVRGAARRPRLAPARTTRSWSPVRTNTGSTPRPRFFVPSYLRAMRRRYQPRIVSGVTMLAYSLSSLRPRARPFTARRRRWSSFRRTRRLPSCSGSTRSSARRESIRDICFRFTHPAKTETTNNNANRRAFMAGSSSTRAAGARDGRSTRHGTGRKLARQPLPSRPGMPRVGRLGWAWVGAGGSAAAATLTWLRRARWTTLASGATTSAAAAPC